jgi:hypothetical protein
LMAVALFQELYKEFGGSQNHGLKNTGQEARIVDLSLNQLLGVETLLLMESW